jgi:replicative DNA helicase
MLPYNLTTSKDIEREEALLLGTILLHPEKLGSVRTLLQPEDFSEDRHRLIYEALLIVPNTSDLGLVDALRLLLSQDELERVGGLSYLTVLTQQAKDLAAPIEDQMHLLKQTRLKHLLNRVGEVLRSRTQQDEGGDLKPVIADLERAVAITQQMFSAGTKPLPPKFLLQTALDDYLSSLDARRRQHMALSGLPTGFVDLDTITGGLQRSDLVIIAGPPSVGKTSFALSIALYVLLKEHRSVGLFSLEASKRQVIERLLSMEAHLDQRLLRSLKIEDDEWEQLGKASAILSEAKLWIDDTANLSTEQLYNKAYLFVKHCGVELLIIDYVHLMLSNILDKRSENRVQEIGEISRSLKVLARELDIPVLALAQVSRAFESRPTKKLQLSDLRDGSLENDADLVLFLPVNEKNSTDSSARHSATISIAKHRNGSRADLDICFEPRSTRFYDLETLSPKPVSKQPSFSSKQTKPQLERLQDIMARMPKRQTTQENPKPFSSRRELPRGYVLEDGEVESELGTKVAFPDELEQNHA